MNKMKIVNVPLNEIIPYENNPRVNEGAVEQLAKIISEFGFRNPAVLNKDKVVIEGHTRLLACKKLGWETMPCIIATDLTPDQEKALRIADNKIAEIADWDEAKLKIEMLALQEAGFDVSLLAFDDNELDELLGDEATVHGETEPDAAPDVPEVAVSKPGEIYKLGKHLLVCGDSTKSEDIAKVCKSGEADLWLTDPPYNVDYHGSDGQSIQNDSMEDSKFREFLRTAFGYAEEALKPGAPFYIFHADSEGYNFRGACFDVGLRVRQCLVWKKNSLVLGRQDYHWIHEPCQPPGTMIRMPKGKEEKPIEELCDGDKVVSFDSYSGTLRGLRNGLSIKTASRFYDGKLYRVSVDNKATRATDNHEFTVRFNPKAKKHYCTFLMRRGDWWRVGHVRVYETNEFGIKMRCFHEDADEAWMLGYYRSEWDAYYAEQKIALKYAIPYAQWKSTQIGKTQAGSPCIDEEYVAKIYEDIDPAKLRESAMRLLDDFNRSEKYPMYLRCDRGKKWSTRSTSRFMACNLVPGLMQLPVPRAGFTVRSDGRSYDWRTIESVEAEPYSGTVYSLAVDKWSHYISDGIVTHNCLYGWKEGAAHNWFADRTQTTVMEFDKPKKNDVHPTMKPVEMLVYLIGNSSKRGAVVLDTFGGSGSTMIACEKTGRVCRCVELDPKYCDVIRRRWAEFVHGEGCEWEKLTPVATTEET